jgi:hypothetical protein
MSHRTIDDQLLARVRHCFLSAAWLTRSNCGFAQPFTGLAAHGSIRSGFKPAAAAGAAARAH